MFTLVKSQTHMEHNFVDGLRSLSLTPPLSLSPSLFVCLSLCLSLSLGEVLRSALLEVSDDVPHAHIRADDQRHEAQHDEEHVLDEHHRELAPALA